MPLAAAFSRAHRWIPTCPHHWDRACLWGKDEPSVSRSDWGWGGPAGAMLGFTPKCLHCVVGPQEICLFPFHSRSCSWPWCVQEIQPGRGRQPWGLETLGGSCFISTFPSLHLSPSISGCEIASHLHNCKIQLNVR